MFTGRILVEFKDGVTKERINEINISEGMETCKILDLSSVNIKIYVLKGLSGQNSVEMVAKYSRIPQVKFAEPEIKHRIWDT